MVFLKKIQKNENLARRELDKAAARSSSGSS
jgi:hypothetical protein